MADERRKAAAAVVCIKCDPAKKCVGAEKCPDIEKWLKEHKGARYG